MAMGALPKPAVPEGPVQALFERLHALHHRAGWPSLREMAKEVGCSHSTVSAAFSEPRVPRWGLLELIVEALGGDTEEFHRMWLAASHPEGEPAPPAPVHTHAPAALAPRQLPADVVAFTGRGEQLAALDRLLPAVGSAAAVIAAISGTAGVGKTALAVNWAHRVAARFPDGQLYVDVRGYHPGRPMLATEVLEGFLRELGMPAQAIPPQPAERAARYRTLLASRRMLILLDNANSVDQIRDLLPGSGSSFVLVTSRDRLPGLVARYGAVRVNLDLLPLAEALVLLRTLVGARVDTEAEASVVLVERCARLPLALRLAAEMAAAWPDALLADLLAELTAEPLELFGAGEDEFTAVRAVFSWSCRHLSPLSERAFAMLGAHPGRDFEVLAVAALLVADQITARRVLGELARTHLVEETGAGRYRMHDLLRAYAAERVAGLPEDERWAAVGRLLDHYLSAAAVALDRPGPAGRAWLDAELPNVLATAEVAAPRFPALIRRASQLLAGCLDGRARYADALALHTMAHAAAVAEGDPVAAAEALNLLGTVHRRLGRYGEARRRHREALALHRDAGNPVGEADAYHGLGVLCWRRGQYQEAHEHLSRARILYQEAGHRSGEGNALYGLGIVSRRLGRYAEAVEYHQRSATVHRETGDRIGESRALGNLGVVYMFLGRYQEALEHQQVVLDLYREMDDRVGYAVVLTNIANTYERLGRYDEALRHHEQALSTCREVGYRVGEGDALHGLGVVYRRLGRYGEALEHLRQAVWVGRDIGEADVQTAALIDLAEALRDAGRPDEALADLSAASALAEQTGDRYEQARALAAIAAVRAAAGDTAEAQRYWRQARDIYRELGLPDADEIARQIPSALPSS
jgi:tetratricopeptide (TPR) repeat protein